MPYYVYILASKPYGTFYTGVTNDLVRRISEHQEGTAESFTKRYGITQLVYHEAHSDIEQAILREKRIKRWARAKKIAAIEAHNPEWQDLYPLLF
jgi:putative endonuclease